MLINKKLDEKVIDNLSKVNFKFLFFPFLLLILIACFFILSNNFSVNGYIHFQEDLFFYLNKKLSYFSSLQFNITQLGDALVFLSLLSILIVYYPKLWGALLSSLIVSGLVTYPLKKLFAVPRPAAIINTDSFTIIGRKLTGYTSLPSGHSVTVFSIISILFFAFMMKGFKRKTIWYFSFLIIGSFLVLSRVGVGAHYPIDVLIGGVIGYICAVLGVLFNNNYNLWSWIKNIKYYPIFIVLFTVSTFIILKKIYNENLFILYISLFSLILTLYLMINTYVKEKY